MAHSTSTKRKTSRPLLQKKPRAKVKRTAPRAAQDQSNIPEIDLGRAQKTVLDLLKIPGISGKEKQVAEAIRKKLLINLIETDSTKAHLIRLRFHNKNVINHDPPNGIQAVW